MRQREQERRNSQASEGHPCNTLVALARDVTRVPFPSAPALVNIPAVELGLAEPLVHVVVHGTHPISRIHMHTHTSNAF
jgi:hypothetical protein